MQITRLGFSRALARLAGLTGQLPALELEQAVLPVANVHNLDDPPFHEKRGATHGTLIAAVAGQRAALYIRAVESTIVVVRRLAIVGATGVAQTYGVEFIDVPHAGLARITPADWDNRGTLGGGSYSPVDCYVGTTAAGFGGGVELTVSGQLNGAVGAEGHALCPLVLRAGDGVAIGCLQVNTAAFLDFYADIYDV